MDLRQTNVCRRAINGAQHGNVEIIMSSHEVCGRWSCKVFEMAHTVPHSVTTWAAVNKKFGVDKEPGAGVLRRTEDPRLQARRDLSRRRHAGCRDQRDG